ncbi:GIY-YIG nuclease family protein [Gemmobacter sp. LW-1]|uniref:GIY-YIG nuclease family protein n=1 Tax=Gemmobacter sp. LW-1 TaxID=1529005 RepID=UPI0006C75F30|nr:GIY-YIG nuclease family protein [Gemmobacter sp. LW-1]
MSPAFAYVVYKITFPNGKIYIGKDIGGGGHSLRYFGSWNNASVEADFSRDEMRSFVLRKEILFESYDKVAVTRKESELIRRLNASDPTIGYNRTHRRRVISGDPTQEPPCT